MKTGRSRVEECILPEIFRKALQRINPQIDTEILNGIVKEHQKDYTGTDMVDTNYKFYNQLRNGIRVKIHKNGREDFDIVKLIDFDDPKNNDFHCVSQMWIKRPFPLSASGCITIRQWLAIGIY